MCGVALDSFNWGRKDFQNQVIHAVREASLLNQFVLHLDKASDQNSVFTLTQIQVVSFLHHGIIPLLVVSMIPL